MIPIDPQLMMLTAGCMGVVPVRGGSCGGARSACWSRLFLIALGLGAAYLIFGANGSSPGSVEPPDTGMAEQFEVTPDADSAARSLTAPLDDIIRKLEQSEGPPPIAELLRQMHELKLRLSSLDAVVTDPAARRKLAEQLSAAAAALDKSLDALHRMDEHELPERIRTQLDRWGTLLDGRIDVDVRIEPPLPPFPPSAPPLAPTPAATTPDIDRAWRAEADSVFEADLYPSAESAAGALGRALSPVIQSALPPEHPTPATIEIGGQAIAQQADIGYALAGALRERFPQANVVVVASELPNERPNGDGDVRVIVGSTPGAGSTLRALALTSTGEHHRTVRYIEKPWLMRFDEYVSARPGQALFLARSALAHSREEASRQAVADAVRQITPMVVDHLAQHSTLAHRPDWREHLDPWLNDHLTNAVRQGYNVEDRFAQRLVFPTTGADQWREAILVSVKADNLASLQRIAETELQRFRAEARMREAVGRRTALGAVAASIGLVTLLTVVYLFLQAATRGYYRWMVRLAVFVLLIAGVAIMVIVA